MDALFSASQASVALIAISTESYSSIMFFDQVFHCEVMDGTITGD
jgi:hypothetical protein